jgi:hypothetical protein
VLGLGLTTQTVESELAHFNQLDFAGKAVTAYNTLGFAKYLLESGSYASRIARTSGIRFLGAAAESKTGNLLANLTSKNALTKADLPAATAFKAFGSFYYLTGAFANGASAYDAAAAGDPVTAGLDSANALGNVLLAANASKSGIAAVLGGLGIDAGEDAAANALDLAGPVGAGISILAQFGLGIYSAIKAKDAQNKLQDEGQQFLEDGLGMRSNVAFQLADVSDNQHVGPSQVLQAYASQYDIKPQSLMQFLNTKNADDVGNFVYLTAFVNQGKNGKYEVSSSSDTTKLSYIPGVPVQNVDDNGVIFPDSPIGPMSLRQLHYWADRIFGPEGSTATG